MPCFLSINNIPLYKWIIFHCKYRPPSVYPFIVWWTLWIMLLWTWGHTCLFQPLFSVLLGIYLEAELVDHMAILCLTFCGLSIPFSTAAAPFYIPTSNTEGSNFSTSLQTLVIFCFLFVFDNRFSMRMKSYLTVVLIWNSLMNSSVEHNYWPFVYPVWRNVYSSLLLI